MSKNDDLDRYPATPPDPREIHRTIERTNQSWPWMKPITAILLNWHAWAVALAMYAYFRSPEIIQGLDSLVGVTP